MPSARIIIGFSAIGSAILAAAAVLYLNSANSDPIQQPPSSANCLADLALMTPDNNRANMIALGGGKTILGARALLAEEGPTRLVEVEPFMIGRTDVTNEQFAAFAAATGYRTLAERRGNSLVFAGAKGIVDPNNPGQWWRVVAGANWRHPMGPGSSIEHRGHLPVVHVALEDALAFAQWLGHDLPSEAEWEYAARGGLEGARYVWGEDPPDNSTPQANIWQGIFPLLDSGDDGYKATPSPVGCFPANGFGLYDMAGNVWQWTKDEYRAGLAGHNAAPGAGESAGGTRHMIKGGSFLCADNFCLRYRPDARSGAAAQDGMSHIGFRTVLRGINIEGESSK